MQRKHILGIDPGLSGAMTVLCPRTDSIILVCDMPTELSGVGNRRQINVAALALKMDSFIDEVAFCVFEEVHSISGDGPVGAFAFGKSAGILIGMLGAHTIPIFFTPPQIWKPIFGLSKNKNESRALAIKKFPISSDLFARTKDDGRAESALLAYFGKRFL